MRSASSPVMHDLVHGSFVGRHLDRLERTAEAARGSFAGNSASSVSSASGGPACGDICCRRARRFSGPTPAEPDRLGIAVEHRGDVDQVDRFLVHHRIRPAARASRRSGAGGIFRYRAGSLWAFQVSARGETTRKRTGSGSARRRLDAAGGGAGKWIGITSVPVPAKVFRKRRRDCAASFGSQQKIVDQSGSRHCSAWCIRSPEITASCPRERIWTQQ